MGKSVTSTVKGKVGGGLKKISKGADWIGAVAGYVGSIASASSSWGGELLPDIISMHVNAVTRHNVSALTDIPARLGDSNWNPVLMTGVGAAVIGTIAGYLPSLIPHQSTISNIVAKAGIGAVVGSLAAIAVSELAQGSNPFDAPGTKSGSSQGGASTAGRVPFPGMVKSQAKYPSDGRKTWAMPRD